MAAAVALPSVGGMTTRTPPRPASPATPRRLATAVVRGLGLVPASLGELWWTVRGDPQGATRTARRHAGLGETDGAPGAGRVLLHAVLGTGLGLVAWFLTWLMLLGTARGPLYGFVDPGPYDAAWGGPSLAGAWAVHAAVWVPIVVAWSVLVGALGALHRRLTVRLIARTGPRWPLPGSVLVTLVAVVLVRAWIRQL